MNNIAIFASGSGSNAENRQNKRLNRSGGAACLDVDNHSPPRRLPKTHQQTDNSVAIHGSVLAIALLHNVADLVTVSAFVPINPSYAH